MISGIINDVNYAVSGLGNGGAEHRTPRGEGLRAKLFILFGKDETVEGLVLVLGLELRFVGGAGSGVCQGCLGGGSCLTELVLACQFGFGEGFGTRIADLRSEVGLTHFLEDDLGVLADFAAEGSKWGFQIVLTHNFSFLGASTAAPLRSILVIMST